jgi:branched-chain amino acid transport system substrate-binding protein
VCQQSGVPLVSPTATSPYVTEIGEFIVRICFTDPFQSKALAEFTRNILRSERIAIIFEENSAYSEKLAEFYAQRLEDMGGQVVFSESFERSPSELLTLLDEALETNPDLFFLPMYYPEAAAAVNHLVTAGKSITLLGSDGWESPEFFRLSDDYAGQIYMSSHGPLS